MDQLNNWSKLLFWSWTVIYDLYLFHFMVLINPDFSCFKSLWQFLLTKWQLECTNLCLLFETLIQLVQQLLEKHCHFLPLSLSYQLKHNFLIKLKSTPLRNLLMVCLNSSKSELDVLVEYQLQFYFYLLHHCQLYC